MINQRCFDMAGGCIVMVIMVVIRMDSSRNHGGACFGSIYCYHVSIF